MTKLEIETQLGSWGDECAAIPFGRRRDVAEQVTLALVSFFARDRGRWTGTYTELAERARDFGGEDVRASDALEVVDRLEDFGLLERDALYECGTTFTPCRPLLCDDGPYVGERYSIPLRRMTDSSLSCHGEPYRVAGSERPPGSRSATARATRLAASARARAVVRGRALPRPSRVAAGAAGDATDLSLAYVPVLRAGEGTSAGDRTRESRDWSSSGYMALRSGLARWQVRQS